MSFWKHCYHIVWSTKAREPLILSEIKPRLYAYLAYKAGELGVFIYAINGTEDHIHIVVAIPPKQSVAWVMKMLKGASAHFVNTELRPAGIHFAWQRGYGSLTIGERQRAAAMDYVEQQETHHRAGTTNVWLERYDDDEEGDFEATSVTSMLRESGAVYNVALDLPW